MECGAWEKASIAPILSIWRRIFRSDCSPSVVLLPIEYPFPIILVMPDGFSYSTLETPAFLFISLACKGDNGFLLILISCFIGHFCPVSFANTFVISHEYQIPTIDVVWILFPHCLKSGQLSMWQRQDLFPLESRAHF